MTAKKVHILIVANTSWNIYNFRLNVIRRLLDEGYLVTVCAPIDQYIKYRKSFPEVKHIALRHFDRYSINPLKDLNLMRELFKTYRNVKPDLVVHYTVKPNIYGGIAAGILRIPSIAVVTGLGYPFIHNGMIRKLTKVLYSISARFHKVFIFENEDDRQLFISDRLVSENQSLAVDGCGVDTVHFRPDILSEQKHKLVFTFIGRLLIDKGIREFVEAAQLINKGFPKAEFWIAGELDRHNPSSAKEEDLILWVQAPFIHYLGEIQDVRTIIAASDCVVLPSYREGLSKSIMEAMAMEKPVIGTDTTGIRDAIDHNVNGFLVKVRDSNALAEAMNTLAKMSDEERRKMGKKGREKVVEKFDDAKIATDIVEVMKSVMNGSIGYP